MQGNIPVSESIRKYSWVIVVVAVFAIAFFAVNSEPSLQQQSSACYIITPGISCTQSIFLSNSTSSTFMLILSNQLGTNASFAAQSIITRPNLTSDYFVGSCTPSTAAPGATILCMVKMDGFVEPVGTQLNPTFNIIYTQCTTSGCRPKMNVSGFASATAQEYQSLLYFVTLSATPQGAGAVLLQNVSYNSGSVVGAIEGEAYNISVKPHANYTFIGWFGNENFTISDASSQQATLIVIGNGTLLASFAKISTTSTEVSSTSLSTKPPAIPTSRTTTRQSTSTTSFQTQSTTSTLGATTQSTSLSTASSTTSISTSQTTSPTTIVPPSSLSTSTSTIPTSSSTSIRTTTSSTPSTSTSQSTSQSTSLSTSQSTSISTRTTTITTTICSACGASFLADTQVMLISGEYEPIRSLRPGESVLSYNTKTGKFYSNTVIMLLNYTIYGEYTINGNVNTDAAELFYTKGGVWTSASSLKAGESIYDPLNGSWINVNGIIYTPAPIEVYDVIGSSGNDFLVQGGYLADLVTR